jgi:hypothetical protein
MRIIQLLEAQFSAINREFKASANAEQAKHQEVFAVHGNSFISNI